SWTSSVCLMDNDMNVTGDRFHPRSLGQLIRLCLLCRVIPVFTPDRQPAANARGERYNGFLQERVRQRDRFRTLPYLMPRCYHFQMASNTYLTRQLIHQGQHARVNGTRCPCPSVCLTHWHAAADRSGWSGASMKTTISRCSMKRFASPHARPMSLSAWLFGLARKPFRCTGPRPNRGGSNGSRIEPTASVTRPTLLCSEVMRRPVTSAPVPEGQVGTVSDVLSRM